MGAADLGGCTDDRPANPSTAMRFNVYILDGDRPTQINSTPYSPAQVAAVLAALPGSHVLVLPAD